MTGTPESPDRRSRLRLYLVATSHLDSQWRWTIQTTIRHFLLRTLRDNFARMREFPGYVLSFEGAFRYQLAEEYFPKEFQQVIELVREGRWCPAGGMLDAPDTNLPSPESLIRHLLYGNDYFEEKFGRRSADIFLPDCFGFPWSLPTIAAHCGIKGFSSQKHIRWMAPSKLPFDIGRWEGPDGSSVVAVLDPGGYGKSLRENLSRSPESRRRLEDTRRRTGLAIGYRYFGLGDRGGAPDETSLDYLAASLAGDGDIEVVHSGSDQFFLDLAPEDIERLPVHRGDLLLPTHGTGCWTSQKVLKRWNRNCELLAEAAERASLLADWLDAEPYPAAALRREWTRFLWHQMHDDLTGTSSPEAYRFTSNDLVLTQNRFTNLLSTGVGAAARALDTTSAGQALVVFNALEFPREELVDAWVRFEGGPPGGVRVVDPRGAEVPCQVLDRDDRGLRILFPASMPSLGLAVFEVLPAPEAAAQTGPVTVTESSLENDRYRVELGTDGSIESIFDKALGRELLAESADIRLLPDLSDRWPAWEIRYEDICKEAVPIEGPANFRIVESGPVRVKLEIARRSGATKFRQAVSLASGQAGSRVVVEHNIDWRCPGKLLKAVFPLAIAPAEAVATYDMGLGSVEREPNCREKYEVPAHEWADLSAADWGVSIASRHNYGWDRPDSTTLRLSLLRSPKALRRFGHQASQDYGRHRLSYALSGHGGGAQADISASAASLNQRLFAFRAASHPGALGRSFSLFRLEGPARLMALKQAERGEQWIARLRETAGRRRSRVDLSGAGAFTHAAQTDGCERGSTALETEGGRLSLDLPRFAPRSLRLTVAGLPEGSARTPLLEQEPIALDFDTQATSFHGQGAVNFDGDGHSLPGELFPSTLRERGLLFRLGPNLPKSLNALALRGQKLELPAGGFDRLAFLAASTEPGGTLVDLQGPETQAGPICVPYYSGFVGQWQLFSGRVGFLLRRVKPGFIERTPVAWTATHRHDRRTRDEAYIFCYLFFFEVPVPAGTRAVTLPVAPSVKLFSATASKGARWALEPAGLFYE